MLAAVVGVGFFVALVAPWCIRHFGAAWGPRLLAIYPAIVFMLAATAEYSQPEVQATFDWVPRFGLRWSALIDGWSVLFTALISGIGVLVVLYGAAYLRHHAHLGRFYLYLIGFMAAMLGVVLASNLFLLFVCWELTSIFSYLLIGFEHEEAKSRKSALQALLTTGVGGLALLVACVLLYQLSGTWELADMIARPLQGSNPNVEIAVVVLLLAAAFTKSAQFPFHYWLPAAMAAPTPVSAYLHSATMVKAGVFLLARFQPVFQEHWLWQPSLLVAGGTTMLVGAALALPQRDLKLLLAYSTVSALGTLTFLLGLGSSEAIAACVVFLAAHALYKGGLFFFAGVVDHETGTRDIELVGQLASQWPLLATVASVLGLSMAGIMPLFGFVAKELAYEAALHAAVPFAVIVLVLGSALQAAVAGFAVARPLFLGSHPPRSSHHKPEWELVLGPTVLAIASLAAVVFPGASLAPLLGVAATSVAGAHTEVDLTLWHGWTLTFALSLATALLGVGAFFLRPLWCAVADRGRGLRPTGPAAVYEAALAGLAHLAQWQTRTLQTGKLRQYQVLVLTTAVGSIVFALALAQGELPKLAWEGIYPTEAAVIVAMVAGMLITILTSSRLTAIAGLGITGYAVGIFFLVFGAPDLAMTQFAIETLTVILFVLVLYRLPRFESRSSSLVRARDAALATAVGASISALVLLLLAEPTPSALAPYFIANSETLAHGRNVVNVILVDFRSLDTLGEITVLGLAAMGVGALMAMWGKYR